MAVQLNGQEVGPIKFTDNKPGKTVHVGLSAPANPVDGDVWIDADALNNAGKNLLQTIDLSTGGSTKTCTVSSDYKDAYIVIRGLNITALANLTVTINGDTSASYADSVGASTNALFTLQNIKASVSTNHVTFTIVDTYDSTSHVWAKCEGFYTAHSTNLSSIFLAYGLWRNTSPVTSIDLTLSAGAFAGGTVLVYGVN
jgi:hypothetical protein